MESEFGRCSYDLSYTGEIRADLFSSEVIISKRNFFLKLLRILNSAKLELLAPNWGRCADVF